MDQHEKKLSDYIDRLNEERKPVEHGGFGSTDLNELYTTVRWTKSLREPCMPEEDFPQRMASQIHREQSKGKKNKGPWVLGGTWVAAILIFALVISILSPLGQLDVIHAMEEAFRDVKAYHGVLEIVETNGKGETLSQAKIEVWADQEGRYLVKGMDGSQKDVITANDGERKWQIQPHEKQVVLYPSFPDSYRFSLEPGKEIENVKSAVETKTMGSETIAGRKAMVIQVTPQGGTPYKLWMDEETKLPLQRESAMSNDLQYKVTYTSMEIDPEFPKDLFNYKLPEGYKEVENIPMQKVGSLEEAGNIVGYPLNTLGMLPEGYTRKDISVNLDSRMVRVTYALRDQHVVVTQSEAIEDFQPSNRAILGKIGDRMAEVLAPIQGEEGILGGGIYAQWSELNSIRWQQKKYEYEVIGDVSLEELEGFIQGMTHEKVALSPEGVFQPGVEVPVDLEIEKADQRNADEGHSLYKLDPVYATQVFVSLEISPEGIQGDYPVKEAELKLLQNNGERAIVALQSKETKIRNVYLERLVRKDSTGIWTVVGYDLED